MARRGSSATAQNKAEALWPLHSDERESVILSIKTLILPVLLCLASAAFAGDSPEREPNRLVDEKSPYLLQHAYNPVDWYPWGNEAFEKAREENKPVFLSIGYSTCHWCHVMERESFSDPVIARLLNEKFVSIKVDREERPDVDAMYQAFLAATGSDGGWPTTIFLTPDLQPFYGGTYFPPRDRGGRVGLETIIERLGTSWAEHQDQIEATSRGMMRAITSFSAPVASDAELDESVIDKAFAQLSSRYQNEFGGFSPAPKFPQPVIHELLLRYHSRHASERAARMSIDTLDAMASGGIYDQIGGGFHRYATDAAWNVPHFEKMLYDQAQLVNVYLSAHQITGELRFRTVAAETLEFVLASMTSPEGAFYSALDASSLPSTGSDERREGAFYTWSWNEAASLFDEKLFPLIAEAYGIRKEGNVDGRFDQSGELSGRNILTRRVPVRQLSEKYSLPEKEVEAILLSAKRKFASARSTRPSPPLDDKILTSWNGLMISAFARSSQILDDRRYLESAVAAAEFAASRLRDAEEGHLWRRWRGGDAAIEGFAEDYAFLIQGLLDLYDASFEVRWLELARELQQQQDALFWDSANGYYSLAVAEESSPLIDIPGDVDSVLPSHNSVSAMNLMRLGQLTGNEAWLERPQVIMKEFGGILTSNPQTMPLMVSALSSSLAKPKQIIIAGQHDSPDTVRLLSLVHERYLPDRLLILADGSGDQKRLSEWMPFLEYVEPLGGRATAYVCEDFVCKIPSSDPAVVARQLSTRAPQQ